MISVLILLMALTIRSVASMEAENDFRVISYHGKFTFLL